MERRESTAFGQELLDSSRANRDRGNFISYGADLHPNGFDIQRLERLVNQNLSNNREILSRQLTELQDAHDGVLVFLHGAGLSVPDDDCLIEPAGLCSWERLAFNFDELFERCLRSTEDKSESSLIQLIFLLVESARLLTLLVVKRLARRVLVRMRQAKVRLSRLRRTTTLCGIAWPKRAWFLLHGSHPPKPELGHFRGPSVRVRVIPAHS